MLQPATTSQLPRGVPRGRIKGRIQGRTQGAYPGANPGAHPGAYPGAYPRTYPKEGFRAFKTTFSRPSLGRFKRIEDRILTSKSRREQNIFSVKTRNEKLVLFYVLGYTSRNVSFRNVICTCVLIACVTELS